MKSLFPSCFLFLALSCCTWKFLSAKEVVVLHERGFLYKYKVFEYEDEDLVDSVSLGRRCEAFIVKQTQTFGVDGEDESETKPHAIDVCKQVAAELNLSYDPEAYYAHKRQEAWESAKATLEFLKNGWIVATDVLPDLKDEIIIQNILQTLKKRKFEHIIDAIDKAKNIWELNTEEAAVSCGEFDEAILSDDNLVDDEVAEFIYRSGVEYMECVSTFYSEKREDKVVYPPFSQAMNIHRINSVVYDLATSANLGYIAAFLLRHNTVRLYQTALYLKDASSVTVPTEWQRDLSVMPLDTREGGALTFWCPLLRSLNHANGDSLLRFVSESHRDLSREHWYGSNYEEYVTFGQAGVLSIGDCTVHHGWTKYNTAPQANDDSRLAIGFTYVIGDATVLQDLPAESSNRHLPFRNRDEVSFHDWIKDLKEGDVIDHPLLPLVFNSRILQPQKTVIQMREFDDDSPARYLYESYGMKYQSQS